MNNYDLTLENISTIESNVQWFKENNKKLTDYLFKTIAIENIDPINKYGRVTKAIYDVYQLKVNPKLPMPGNIHSHLLMQLAPFALMENLG